jgi:hypothetical protein
LTKSKTIIKKSPKSTKNSISLKIYSYHKLTGILNTQKKNLKSPLKKLMKSLYKNKKVKINQNKKII